QDEEIFHSKRNDYAYRSIGECEREDRDSEPGSERRRRRQGDRIPNCKTTFRRIAVGLDWRDGHIVDVEVNGKGSCSLFYRAVVGSIPAVRALQQDRKGGRSRQGIAPVTSQNAGKTKMKDAMGRPPQDWRILFHH